MQDANNSGGGSSSHVNNPEAAVTIQRIQELLKTKNDTSRFVGLALLKSVLDNSPQLREDEEAVTTLWHSVSPKFLDRLLRSGAKQGPSPPKDARDMIDIAVAVVHIFSVLLPDDSKKDSSLVGRIPALVSVVLHRWVGLPSITSTFADALSQLWRDDTARTSDSPDPCQQGRRSQGVCGHRRCQRSRRDCSITASRIGHLPLCILAVRGLFGRCRFYEAQDCPNHPELDCFFQGNRCCHAAGFSRRATTEARSGSELPLSRPLLSACN